MAKYVSTILAAALVATLAACSGDDEDEPSPNPGTPAVVYSAGGVYASAAAQLGTATVWRDETVIKQLTGQGTFTSVCVSGGVVHAVGALMDGATARPYYWKSSPDAGAYLPAVGIGTATAVCVQGGNVYVAGYDQEGGKVWRNGTLLHRLEGYPQSWPWSIAVDTAGNVFTAGEDLYGAAIWENDEWIDGIDEEDGFDEPYFSAVGFANGVVYAAGTADYRPVWMKENGVPNYLGNADGEATSLHLPGDGYLYVAFTDESSALLGSRVYKGMASGVTMAPAANVVGSRIGSVFVLGGDIYSGGAQVSADLQSFSGGVWRNSTKLRNLPANSVAHSIYVVAQ
jgi:hypothetical protein